MLKLGGGGAGSPSAPPAPLPPLYYIPVCIMYYTGHVLFSKRLATHHTQPKPKQVPLMYVLKGKDLNNNGMHVCSLLIMFG